jgi:hypothetical protein
MPFAEALKRAGSLEALLPHLREGRILARHKGLFTWPEARPKSGPGNIRPEWWANARVDPATGRVILTTPGSRITSAGRPPPPPTIREVFAIGIELEGAAVETLFPVATVSAPLKPPGRKSGAKPSPVWQQIFDYFDPLVASKGKFHSLGSAASSVEAWLREDKRRVKLHHSTLKRGIQNNRPDWFEA